MRDDLRFSQELVIDRSVSVTDQSHVIAHADRTAGSSIDAVFSHAPGYDEMLDASRFKLALERRLKERIRSSLSNDQVFFVRFDLWMNLPAFSANLERVASFAIVLNEDDRHVGRAGFRKKLVDLLQHLWPTIRVE